MSIAVFLSGNTSGQLKSDAPVRISGRVSDASNASVADATVDLKPAGSSVLTAVTKTSRTGEYEFQAVPPRSYEIHVTAPGFKSEMKLVTADKDVDVGTLMLAVDAGAGSGRVEMESPADVRGSADTPQTEVRGRYTNVDYGYAADIPAGVVGKRDSAPNPNHGFAITLHPKSVIWVEAQYDVPDKPQTFGILNSRLGALKAERKSWKTMEDGHEGLHQAVAARGFDRGTSIIYTIQVDTTAEHRDSAYRVFEALVRSFRTIP